MILKSAGMLTTVQDLGRSHLQHLGVPGCGAMDRRSMAVANALVGNPRGAAVLECTWSGPVIEFEKDTALALAGAAVRAKLNGYEVPMYTTLLISRGDVLDLTHIEQGARLYLAVDGGIDVPLALGSRSTYLAVQFGDMDRRLKNGDALPLKDRKTVLKSIQLDAGSALRRVSPAGVQTVRIVEGPQANAFSEETRRKLAAETYTLSTQSDRMGMRFDGAALEPEDKTPMISDGIAFGSMQITRGGQPIVMMADRQPTGGYPKIAKVARCDLPLLAQMRPGEEVRFEWISLEESRTAFLAEEDALQALDRRYADQPEAARVFNTYLQNKLFQVAVMEIDD